MRNGIAAAQLNKVPLGTAVATRYFVKARSARLAARLQSVCCKSKFFTPAFKCRSLRGRSACQLFRFWRCSEAVLLSNINPNPERRLMMWNLMPWKNNNSMQGGLLTSDPVEREFSRIRDDFDQLIQRMWSGGSTMERTFDHRWGMDVDESESHFIVRLEAPGFEVEDFDVRMRGDHLLITAEHKESHEGNGGSNYRYGRFERSVPLPTNSKTDEIEACYRNGILEVKLPKGEETQNVKRIAVKAG
jgi:HSP20 family protein